MSGIRIVFAAIGSMALGSGLTACGKCGDKPVDENTAEVAQASPIEGASTVVDLKLPEGEALGTPDEAGKDALLNALLALEVPGMTRSRATRNGDLVTLQFDNVAPNAAGNIGTVEVSAGFCVGCTPADAGLDDEARLKREKETLGELHADDPNLLIEFGAFELAPQRSGSKIYRKSFAIKDDARGAVHTFAVEFLDANRVIRMNAYPRTGFPETAEAFEAQYTREALEADLRKVFAAAMPVLWPPVKL